MSDDKKKRKTERKLHRLRKRDARIMGRSHRAEGRAENKIDKINASNLSDAEKKKKIQKIYDKTDRKLKRITRKLPKITEKIDKLDPRGAAMRKGLPYRESKPLATTPKFKMKP